MGSFGREYVLIILFQLYGSEAGLFESNLFWVVHKYDPSPRSLNFHIERRTNPILRNLFKIIPSQKTTDIILQMRLLVLK